MTATRRNMLRSAAALGVTSLPGLVRARGLPTHDVIDAQGDSLTFGWGSHGAGPGEGPYPLQLQRRLAGRYGRPIMVENRGVGGIDARTCAARANAQPMRFSVADNILPSAGPTPVVWFDANPITAQAPAPLTGSFAGIRGTLSAPRFTPSGNPELMTFTREQPGAPLPAPARSQFFTDLGVAGRSHMKLMVYGRNGPKLQPISAAIDGDVAYQDSTPRRWAVGSVLIAVTEIGTPRETQIHGLNQQLADRYGEQYVDLTSPPDESEMVEIGWKPEEGGPYSSGRTDRADIAAGVIPSGMRMGGPGNNQHLNNHGYALWALRFDRHILRQRWFGSLSSQRG